MTHPERVEDYPEHIVLAIDRAARYVAAFDGVDAFREDQLAQDAVIRNIEIIGEAAARIQKESPEFATAHPELPWIEMRGMRNKMIRNYFDVSLEVVWNTIKLDLPRVKRQIDELLKK